MSLLSIVRIYTSMTYLPFKEEVKQRKTSKQILEDLPIEDKVARIIQKRNRYLWVDVLGFIILILCVSFQLITFGAH